MIVSISGWKLPICNERPPSPCGRSAGSGSRSMISRVPSGSFSRSTSRLLARTPVKIARPHLRLRFVLCSKPALP
jgi:hypothetical protein